MKVLRSRSFSGDGGDYFPGGGMIAKFAEVDALPRAEIEAMAGDGDGKRRADDRGLGMGRHVVVSFHRVQIIRLTLLHQAVEYAFHVDTHVGVGIFIDGESR